MYNSGLLPSFKNIHYSHFQHPQAVCMSYFQHCCFSLKLARYFMVGSFKAIVHAFIPNLYITSSSDMIEDVKDEISNAGCHFHKTHVPFIVENPHPKEQDCTLVHMHQ